MGYLEKNSIISIVWRGLNRAIYNSADYIVVLGREIQKNFYEKVSIEQHDKIKYIPNWADPKLIRPVEIDDNPIIANLNLGNKFIVQYSGNMGLTHDMETIIEAANALKKHEDIHFIFIGGGGKLNKIKSMAGKYELENVTFLPYQPRESLKYSLGASHVSLLSLEKEAEGLSVPSKLYGIMASGRPMIALVSENTEVAFTLKEFDCGIVSPPKDIYSLVDSIIWLKDNETERVQMGKKAHKAFLNQFTV